MFVMAGSCMYVWATSVGLRSAIFSRSLIGFKSSSLTPLAMLVRARSSVSVMVLKREVVRPASSCRSRPVTFVYVSR